MDDANEITVDHDIEASLSLLHNEFGVDIAPSEATHG
jgi:hypothetical protein